jgi:ABC-2 type transport system permease protein
MTSLSETTPAPLSISQTIATDARPSVAGPVSASLTFAWRALLRLRHIDQLFDVTVFPLLVLVMFTYLFGGALAGSTEEYLQTVLPGILAMTVIMTTQSTGVALNTDIGKGVFDRFRSLPTWQPGPLVGALLADVVRYAVCVVSVAGVGALMGFRPDAGLPGLLMGAGLIVFFAWSLSWVWTAVGLVARTPEAVYSIGMMITFPLNFVSNVFVDPTTLPGWLQTFVDANPVSHLVTAVRGLIHGHPGTAGEVVWVLLFCAVVVAVFAPLSARLYRRER